LSDDRKYHVDTDAEFDEWWAANKDAIPRLSDEEAARMAFDAGATMERCPHNTTTMAKSRDWCHDCHSWVHREE
jgi:hypothetical protein